MRRSVPGAARAAVGWRSVAGVAVIGALLALAACDDDDAVAEPPSAATASSEPPTPAASATPSPQPTASARAIATARATRELAAYPVPAGSRPHDVAPAADGGVWYTAQGSGELGWLDPETGETRHVALGAGSAPHGVIVGPDGAPWVTDSGLNAIVRLDSVSGAIEVFPLPPDRPGANLNTATFDAAGVLWFTGQTGVYGRLDPATGAIEGVRRAAGPRAVRHRDGAGRGRVLRLAGQQLRGADRPR